MATTAEAMQLDADSAALLAQVRAQNELLSHQDVASLRARMADFMRACAPRQMPVGKSLERALRVDGREINAIVNWPPEQPSLPSPSSRPPVALYFHGGAFTHFSAATHNTVATYLCNKARCIVINVDYRLAPENKFPAAIEDAYDALCWAAANAKDLGGDPTKIVVTGESAGGTISAALCLMARQRGGPAIALQAPMCASFTLHGVYQYRSWQTLGTGQYLLTPSVIDEIKSLYLRTPQDELDPLASPLLAPSVAGLPPALIVTAGFDPLVDEAAAYARRLSEAGVPVSYKCYLTTIHAFMIMAAVIPVGYSALDFVCEHIASL